MAGDTAVQGADRATSELLAQILTRMDKESAALAAHRNQDRQRGVWMAVGIVFAVFTAGAFVALTLPRQLLGTLGADPEDAARVAEAIAQIAQGNGDLAHRTEEQAASLQKTASAMEQLSSTMVQNADNARQANELGEVVKSVAMFRYDGAGHTAHLRCAGAPRSRGVSLSPIGFPKSQARWAYFLRTSADSFASSG